VYNKWDLETPPVDEAQGLLARKLRQRPQVLPVSALLHKGIGTLLGAVADLERRYSEHLPTPALNRFLKQTFQARPAPQRSGRRLKAYYISQYGTAPPRFAIDVNERTLVTRDYAYYVENRLRSTYGLDGVPVIIDFKSSQGRG
jgi:GTPase